MTNTYENDATSDVDESGSLVSAPGRRQLTTIQKVGIAVGVLLAFLFYIWFAHLARLRQAEKQPTASVDLATADFRAAPIALPPPEKIVRPTRQTVPQDTSAADSPIFAFSGSNVSLTTPTALSHAPAPAPAAPAPATSLSVKLQPTVLQITRAALLPHPDMLITQGTMIPCTLQTAVNTELAGFVKCVLPNDVRGTTGDVILLDRGTVVTGEIQSGLQQGQDRVFVLWDRAETPDHAVITLASPATDELGRSGLPGAVNNHLLQRFGGAIMLSVIQGSLQAGAALAGNSGGSSGNYLNNFQSSGSQVADTALQATINIPPTLEKNQGDDISIFVAHDLDFSNIYKLRLVNDRVRSSIPKP